MSEKRNEIMTQRIEMTKDGLQIGSCPRNTKKQEKERKWALSCNTTHYM